MPYQPSRRDFLTKTSALSAGTLTLAAAPSALAATTSPAVPTHRISLDGDWLFHTDPDNTGERQNWFRPDGFPSGSRTVGVPHTWQIEAQLAEYRGVAWYWRNFDVPAPWQQGAVRIEFEAVFHSAHVWINGVSAGEHTRKAYTAFTLDIAHLLQAGLPNTIAVRVDNSFDEHMLPRGRSSDWAHDGGIYRPVHLLVSPPVFLDRVNVDALPDLPTGSARLEIAAYARNTRSQPYKGSLSLAVVDDATGLTVETRRDAGGLNIDAGAGGVAKLTVDLPKAKLWHFDHPHLYRLETSLADGVSPSHIFTSTFGVRRFETKGTAFYFNGERVSLMGVERMAGSNPEFGMAEPAAWIDH